MTNNIIGFSFNMLERVEPSFLHSLRSLIPPLSYSNYKGMMGRVAVIGGSKDYTGAPFYAADGALKFGADLSFIYCSTSAAIPIKSYSPELMVTPFYDEKVLNYSISKDSSDIVSEIENASKIIINGFSRSHVLVIGPGLGRDETVFATTAKVITAARDDGKLIIVDADGLSLISQRPDILRGYSKCILTPNKVEFDRLIESISHEISNGAFDEGNNIRTKLLIELNSSEEEVQTRALSLALGGVTILKKGETDIVTNGGNVFKLGIRGSPRRCGGQGDILAGCLGVSFFWANKDLDIVEDNLRNLLESSQVEQKQISSDISLEDMENLFPEVDSNIRILMSKSITATGQLGSTGSIRRTSHARIRDGAILSTILAVTVVKQAAQLAFSNKGRSMTSPDVLAKIGEAMDHIEKHE